MNPEEESSSSSSSSSSSAEDEEEGRNSMDLGPTQAARRWIHSVTAFKSASLTCRLLGARLVSVRDRTWVSWIGTRPRWLLGVDFPLHSTLSAGSW